jgi:ferrous iron transport protein A
MTTNNHIWHQDMTKQLTTLSKLKLGERGIIERIDETLLPQGIELKPGELERRLLEIGFIEGIEVQVLHFGLIYRDPIALALGSNAMTIAIRRNEAAIVLVNPISTKN